MNRRGFLATLGAAVAALFTPKPTVSGFSVIPDAPFTTEESLSIWYIREFDGLSRMDVLYGFGPIFPEHACIVSPDQFFDPHLDPKRLPV